MRIRGFSKTSLDFVGLQIELLGDDGSLEPCHVVLSALSHNFCFFSSLIFHQFTHLVLFEYY